jgi:hypothetical protein
MSEGPQGTTDLTGFRVLIFFCAAALIAPIAILVLSSVLISLHYYPLSGAFFSVYVMAGVASPVTGVIGLISLWGRRRTFHGTISRVERRLRSYVLILSIMNLFAVVIWAMFIPQMIFSIGGIR